jgi:hypothetical protein
MFVEQLKLGVDLHITRAPTWAFSEEHPITHAEWIAYVQSRDDLEWIDERGLVTWHGTSQYESPWLEWRNGQIATKYPDTALYEEMLNIARSLNAHVEDDDGRRYGRAGEWTFNPTERKATAKPVRGARFAIALLAWLLAAPGILVAIMAAASVVVEGNSSAMEALSLASLFAWICLAVMTHGWLVDRRCHWGWPILGSAIGLPLAIVSAPMLMYLPAVPLATYLVYWHLWVKRPHET